MSEIVEALHEVDEAQIQGLRQMFSRRDDFIRRQEALMETHAGLVIPAELAVVTAASLMTWFSTYQSQMVHFGNTMHQPVAHAMLALMTKIESNATAARREQDEKTLRELSTPATVDALGLNSEFDS